MSLGIRSQEINNMNEINCLYPTSAEHNKKPFMYGLGLAVLSGISLINFIVFSLLIVIHGYERPFIGILFTSILAAVVFTISSCLCFGKYYAYVFSLRKNNLIHEIIVTILSFLILLKRLSNKMLSLI